MMMRRAVVLLVAVCAVACATSAPRRNRSSSYPLRRSHPRPQTPIRRLPPNSRSGLQRDRGPRRKAGRRTKVDVERSHRSPSPITVTIRGALQYFTTDLKPSIQESLIRSAKYKKLIDKALDDYKLPAAWPTCR